MPTPLQFGAQLCVCGSDTQSHQYNAMWLTNAGKGPLIQLRFGSSPASRALPHVPREHDLENSWFQKTQICRQMEFCQPHAEEHPSYALHLYPVRGSAHTAPDKLHGADPPPCSTAAVQEHAIDLQKLELGLKIPLIKCWRRCLERHSDKYSAIKCFPRN